jgi:hypothetical protein
MTTDPKTALRQAVENYKKLTQKMAEEAKKIEAERTAKPPVIKP